jgi:hypothetical protein
MSMGTVTYRYKTDNIITKWARRFTAAQISGWLTSTATALTTENATRDRTIRLPAAALDQNKAANGFVRDLLKLVNVGKAGNLSAAAASGVLTAAAGNLPIPPAVTTAPAVTASSLSVAAAGVLTTTNGTWSGAPTFTRQWLRGTTNIGTGALTYTLVAADETHTISCRVTATNAHGQAMATSNAVGPITA